MDESLRIDFAAHLDTTGFDQDVKKLESTAKGVESKSLATIEELRTDLNAASGTITQKQQGKMLVDAVSKVSRSLGEALGKDKSGMATQILELIKKGNAVEDALVARIMTSASLLDDAKSAASRGNKKSAAQFVKVAETVDKELSTFMSSLLPTQTSKTTKELATAFHARMQEALKVVNAEMQELLKNYILEAGRATAAANKGKGAIDSKKASAVAETFAESVCSLLTTASIKIASFKAMVDMQHEELVATTFDPPTINLKESLASLNARVNSSLKTINEAIEKQKTDLNKYMEGSSYKKKQGSASSFETAMARLPQINESYESLIIEFSNGINSLADKVKDLVPTAKNINQKIGLKTIATKLADAAAQTKKFGELGTEFKTKRGVKASDVDAYNTYRTSVAYAQQAQDRIDDLSLDVKNRGQLATAAFASITKASPSLGKLLENRSKKMAGVIESIQSLTQRTQLPEVREGLSAMLEVSRLMEQSKLATRLKLTKDASDFRIRASAAAQSFYQTYGNSAIGGIPELANLLRTISSVNDKTTTGTERLVRKIYDDATKSVLEVSKDPANNLGYNLLKRKPREYQRKNAPAVAPVATSTTSEEIPLTTAITKLGEVIDKQLENLLKNVIREKVALEALPITEAEQAKIAPMLALLIEATNSKLLKSTKAKADKASKAAKDATDSKAAEGTTDKLPEADVIANLVHKIETDVNTRIGGIATALQSIDLEISKVPQNKLNAEQIKAAITNLYSLVNGILGTVSSSVLTLSTVPTGNVTYTAAGTATATGSTVAASTVPPKPPMTMEEAVALARQRVTAPRNVLGYSTVAPEQLASKIRNKESALADLNKQHPELPEGTTAETVAANIKAIDEKQAALRAEIGTKDKALKDLEDAVKPLNQRAAKARQTGATAAPATDETTDKAFTDALEGMKTAFGAIHGGKYLPTSTMRDTAHEHMRSLVEKIGSYSAPEDAEGREADKASYEMMTPVEKAEFNKQKAANALYDKLQALEKARHDARTALQTSVEGRMHAEFDLYYGKRDPTTNASLIGHINGALKQEEELIANANKTQRAMEDFYKKNKMEYTPVEEYKPVETPFSKLSATEKTLFAKTFASGTPPPTAEAKKSVALTPEEQAKQTSLQAEITKVKGEIETLRGKISQTSADKAEQEKLAKEVEVAPTVNEQRRTLATSLETLRKELATVNEKNAGLEPEVKARHDAYETEVNRIAEGILKEANAAVVAAGVAVAAVATATTSDTATATGSTAATAPATTTTTASTATVPVVTAAAGEVKGEAAKAATGSKKGKKGKKVAAVPAFTMEQAIELARRQVEIPARLAEPNNTNMPPMTAMGDRDFVGKDYPPEYWRGEEIPEPEPSTEKVLGYDPAKEKKLFNDIKSIEGQIKQRADKLRKKGKTFKNDQMYVDLTNARTAKSEELTQVKAANAAIAKEFPKLVEAYEQEVRTVAQELFEAKTPKGRAKIELKNAETLYNQRMARKQVAEDAIATGQGFINEQGQNIAAERARLASNMKAFRANPVLAVNTTALYLTQDEEEINKRLATLVTDEDKLAAAHELQTIKDTREKMRTDPKVAMDYLEANAQREEKILQAREAKIAQEQQSIKKLKSTVKRYNAKIEDSKTKVANLRNTVETMPDIATPEQIAAYDASMEARRAKAEAEAEATPVEKTARRAGLISSQNEGYYRSNDIIGFKLKYVPKQGKSGVKYTTTVFNEEGYAAGKDPEMEQVFSEFATIEPAPPGETKAQKKARLKRAGVVVEPKLEPIYANNKPNRRRPPVRTKMPKNLPPEEQGDWMNERMLEMENNLIKNTQEIQLSEAYSGQLFQEHQNALYTMPKDFEERDGKRIPRKTRANKMYNEYLVGLERKLKAQEEFRARIRSHSARIVTAYSLMTFEALGETGYFQASPDINKIQEIQRGLDKNLSDLDLINEDISALEQRHATTKKGRARNKLMRELTEKYEERGTLVDSISTQRSELDSAYRTAYARKQATPDSADFTQSPHYKATMESFLGLQKEYKKADRAIQRILSSSIEGMSQTDLENRQAELNEQLALRRTMATAMNKVAKQLTDYLPQKNAFGSAKIGTVIVDGKEVQDWKATPEASKPITGEQLLAEGQQQLQVAIEEHKRIATNMQQRAEAQKRPLTAEEKAFINNPPTRVGVSEKLDSEFDLMDKARAETARKAGPVAAVETDNTPLSENDHVRHIIRLKKELDDLNGLMNRERFVAKDKRTLTEEIYNQKVAGINAEIKTREGKMNVNIKEKVLSDVDAKIEELKKRLTGLHQERKQNAEYAATNPNFKRNDPNDPNKDFEDDLAKHKGIATKLSYTTTLLRYLEDEYVLGSPKKVNNREFMLSVANAFQPFSANETGEKFLTQIDRLLNGNPETKTPATLDTPAVKQTVGEVLTLMANAQDALGKHVEAGGKVEEFSPSVKTQLKTLARHLTKAQASGNVELIQLLETVQSFFRALNLRTTGISADARKNIRQSLGTFLPNIIEDVPAEKFDAKPKADSSYERAIQETERELNALNASRGKIEAAPAEEVASKVKAAFSVEDAPPPREKKYLKLKKDKLTFSNDKLGAYLRKRDKSLRDLGDTLNRMKKFNVKTDLPNLLDSFFKDVPGATASIQSEISATVSELMPKGANAKTTLYEVLKYVSYKELSQRLAAQGPEYKETSDMYAGMATDIRSKLLKKMNTPSSQVSKLMAQEYTTNRALDLTKAESTLLSDAETAITNANQNLRKTINPEKKAIAQKEVDAAYASYAEIKAKILHAKNLGLTPAEIQAQAKIVGPHIQVARQGTLTVGSAIETILNGLEDTTQGVGKKFAEFERILPPFQAEPAAKVAPAPAEGITFRDILPLLPETRKALDAAKEAEKKERKKKKAATPATTSTTTSATTAATPATEPPTVKTYETAYEAEKKKLLQLSKELKADTAAFTTKAALDPKTMTPADYTIHLEDLQSMEYELTEAKAALVESAKRTTAAKKTRNLARKGIFPAAPTTTVAAAVATTTAGVAAAIELPQAIAGTNIVPTVATNMNLVHEKLRDNIIDAINQIRLAIEKTAFPSTNLNEITASLEAIQKNILTDPVEQLKKMASQQRSTQKLSMLHEVVPKTVNEMSDKILSSLKEAYPTTEGFGNLVNVHRGTIRSQLNSLLQSNLAGISGKKGFKGAEIQSLLLEATEKWQDTVMESMKGTVTSLSEKYGGKALGHGSKQWVAAKTDINTALTEFSTNSIASLKDIMLGLAPKDKKLRTQITSLFSVPEKLPVSTLATSDPEVQKSAENLAASISKDFQDFAHRAVKSISEDIADSIRKALKGLKVNLADTKPIVGAAKEAAEGMAEGLAGPTEAAGSTKDKAATSSKPHGSGMDFTLAPSVVFTRDSAHTIEAGHDNHNLETLLTEETSALRTEVTTEEHLIQALNRLADRADTSLTDLAASPDHPETRILTAADRRSIERERANAQFIDRAVAVADENSKLLDKVEPKTWAMVPPDGKRSFYRDGEKHLADLRAANAMAAPAGVLHPDVPPYLEGSAGERLNRIDPVAEEAFRKYFGMDRPTIVADYLQPHIAARDGMDELTRVTPLKNFVSDAQQELNKLAMSLYDEVFTNVHAEKGGQVKAVHDIIKSIESNQVYPPANASNDSFDSGVRTQNIATMVGRLTNMARANRMLSTLDVTQNIPADNSHIRALEEYRAQWKEELAAPDITDERKAALKGNLLQAEQAIESARTRMVQKTQTELAQAFKQQIPNFEGLGTREMQVANNMVESLQNKFELLANRIAKMAPNLSREQIMTAATRSFYSGREDATILGHSSPSEQIAIPPALLNTINSIKYLSNTRLPQLLAKLQDDEAKRTSTYRGASLGENDPYIKGVLSDMRKTIGLPEKVDDFNKLTTDTSFIGDAKNKQLVTAYRNLQNVVLRHSELGGLLPMVMSERFDTPVNEAAYPQEYRQQSIDALTNTMLSGVRGRPDEQIIMNSLDTIASVRHKRKLQADAKSEELAATTADKEYSRQFAEKTEKLFDTSVSGSVAAVNAIEKLHNIGAKGTEEVRKVVLAMADEFKDLFESGQNIESKLSTMFTKLTGIIRTAPIEARAPLATQMMAFRRGVDAHYTSRNAGTALAEYAKASDLYNPGTTEYTDYVKQFIASGHTTETDAPRFMSNLRQYFKSLGNFSPDVQRDYTKPSQLTEILNSEIDTGLFTKNLGPNANATHVEQFLNSIAQLQGSASATRSKNRTLTSVQSNFAALNQMTNSLETSLSQSDLSESAQVKLAAEIKALRNNAVKVFMALSELGRLTNEAQFKQVETELNRALTTGDATHLRTLRNAPPNGMNTDAMTAMLKVISGGESVLADTEAAKSYLASQSRTGGLLTGLQGRMTKKSLFGYNVYDQQSYSTGMSHLGKLLTMEGATSLSEDEIYAALERAAKSQEAFDTSAGTTPVKANLNKQAALIARHFTKAYDGTDAGIDRFTRSFSQKTSGLYESQFSGNKDITSAVAKLRTIGEKGQSTTRTVLDSMLSEIMKLVNTTGDVSTQIDPLLATLRALNKTTHAQDRGAIHEQINAIERGLNKEYLSRSIGSAISSSDPKAHSLVKAAEIYKFNPTTDEHELSSYAQNFVDSGYTSAEQAPKFMQKLQRYLSAVGKMPEELQTMFSSDDNLSDLLNNGMNEARISSLLNKKVTKTQLQEFIASGTDLSASAVKSRNRGRTLKGTTEVIKAINDSTGTLLTDIDVASKKSLSEADTAKLQKDVMAIRNNAIKAFSALQEFGEVTNSTQFKEAEAALTKALRTGNAAELQALRNKLPSMNLTSDAQLALMQMLNGGEVAVTKTAKAKQELATRSGIGDKVSAVQGLIGSGSMFGRQVIDQAAYDRAMVSLSKLVTLEGAATMSADELAEALARAARGYNALSNPTKNAAILTTNKQFGLAAAQFAKAYDMQAGKPLLNQNNFLTRDLFHQAYSYTIGMSMYRGMDKAMSYIPRALEYQKKLSELQTLTQEAPISEGQWSKMMMNLSSTYNVDLLDQTEAAYQSISNQVIQAGNAFKYLASTNELANATLSKSSTANNAVSSMLKAYGLTTESTDEVAGKLFQAVNFGRFRLSDIADNIGQVSITSHQLGVSMDEMLAALAAMTVQGIGPAESMTLLRNVIMRLAKPTENLQKFFNQLGVSSGEAAVRAFGLVGVMQKLETYTRGSTDELADMFDRIRSVTGTAALFRAGGEEFRRFNEGIKNSGEYYRNAVRLVQGTDSFKIETQWRGLDNTITEMLHGWVKGIRGVSTALLETPGTTLAALSVAAGIYSVNWGAVRSRGTNLNARAREIEDYYSPKPVQVLNQTTGMYEEQQIAPVGGATFKDATGRHAMAMNIPSYVNKTAEEQARFLATNSYRSLMTQALIPTLSNPGGIRAGIGESVRGAVSGVTGFFSQSAGASPIMSAALGFGTFTAVYSGTQNILRKFLTNYGETTAAVDKYNEQMRRSAEELFSKYARMQEEYQRYTATTQKLISATERMLAGTMNTTSGVLLPVQNFASANEELLKMLNMTKALRSEIDNFIKENFSNYQQIRNQFDDIVKRTKLASFETVYGSNLSKQIEFYSAEMKKIEPAIVSATSSAEEIATGLTNVYKDKATYTRLIADLTTQRLEVSNRREMLDAVAYNELMDSYGKRLAAYTEQLADATAKEYVLNKKQADSFKELQDKIKDYTDFNGKLQDTVLKSQQEQYQLQVKMFDLRMKQKREDLEYYKQTHAAEISLFDLRREAYTTALRTGFRMQGRKENFVNYATNLDEYTARVNARFGTDIQSISPRVRMLQLDQHVAKGQFDITKQEDARNKNEMMQQQKMSYINQVEANKLIHENNVQLGALNNNLFDFKSLTEKREKDAVIEEMFATSKALAKEILSGKVQTPEQADAWSIQRGALIAKAQVLKQDNTISQVSRDMLASIEDTFTSDLSKNLKTVTEAYTIIKNTLAAEAKVTQDRSNLSTRASAFEGKTSQLNFLGELAASAILSPGKVSVASWQPVEFESMFKEKFPKGTVQDRIDWDSKNRAEAWSLINKINDTQLTIGQRLDAYNALTKDKVLNMYAWLKTDTGVYAATQKNTTLKLEGSGEAHSPIELIIGKILAGQTATTGLNALYSKSGYMRGIMGLAPNQKLEATERGKQEYFLRSAAQYSQLMARFERPDTMKAWTPEEIAFVESFNSVFAEAAKDNYKAWDDSKGSLDSFLKAFDLGAKSFYSLKDDLLKPPAQRDMTSVKAQLEAIKEVSKANKQAIDANLAALKAQGIDTSQLDLTQTNEHLATLVSLNKQMIYVALKTSAKTDKEMKAAEDYRVANEVELLKYGGSQPIHSTPATDSTTEGGDKGSIGPVGEAGISGSGPLTFKGLSISSRFGLASGQVKSFADIPYEEANKLFPTGSRGWHPEVNNPTVSTVGELTFDEANRLPTKRKGWHPKPNTSRALFDTAGEFTPTEQAANAKVLGDHARQVTRQREIQVNEETEKLLDSWRALFSIAKPMPADIEEFRIITRERLRSQKQIEERRAQSENELEQDYLIRFNNRMAVVGRHEVFEGSPEDRTLKAEQAIRIRADEAIARKKQQDPHYFNSPEAEYRFKLKLRDYYRRNPDKLSPTTSPTTTTPESIQEQDYADRATNRRRWLDRYGFNGRYISTPESRAQLKKENQEHHAQRLQEQKEAKEKASALRKKRLEEQMTERTTKERNVYTSKRMTELTDQGMSEQEANDKITSELRAGYRSEQYRKTFMQVHGQSFDKFLKANDPANLQLSTTKVNPNSVQSNMTLLPNMQFNLTANNVKPLTANDIVSAFVNVITPLMQRGIIPIPTTPSTK